MSSLFGSICLSDIPKSEIKKVKLKDGSEKLYLNIWVGERKTPAVFGNRAYTHYVSCAPKKEERKEGENYFIGDLQEWKPSESPIISSEEVSASPSVKDDDDLPF